MGSEADRRDGARVQARLKVRFKDAGSFISEYTNNISKGGLFVRTKTPSPEGTTVEVTLTIPEDGLDASALCAVRHVVTAEQASAGQSVGMGLEIKEISAADRERIDAFIAARAQAGEDARGRRDHERRELRILVRFGSVAALREEYSHNLSKGGIFIRTARPHPVGERLMVALVHPKSGEELELSGEVVRLVDEEGARATGQPVGIGVKFLDLAGAKLERLQQFIATA